MAIAIKICGITELTGLAAALDAGIDRIGLMFAPNSPRLINLNVANELAETARGKATIIAVLSNPGDKLVARITQDLRPDFLQLHGKETPDRVRSLWKQHHIPIIKAFAVSQTRDIADAQRYARTAAEFLFDAKPASDENRTGGFGQAFDWSLLQDANPARPWMLAGGLNPENVGAAIDICSPTMVDVSSGVESAPGVKDPALVAQFCTAVRTKR
ncbi:MAG: phosphoribosylanthranilate isomerase [Robiginitomaculum sp.]|nr:MAG: phosphoribosylanthranilate isomerase [Robiginitomaculum sp.]